MPKKMKTVTLTVETYTELRQRILDLEMTLEDARKELIQYDGQMNSIRKVIDHGWTF